MSIDKSFFSLISTPKDTNSVFRSIIIFLNERLRLCRRNKYGSPTTKNILEFENNSIKFLKSSILRLIEQNKQKKEEDTRNVLSLNILSEMYKMTIFVLIEFDEKYACIYKTNSKNNEVYDIQTILREDIESLDDYNYGLNNNCYLLLKDENYSILVPNKYMCNKLPCVPHLQLSIVDILPNDIYNDYIDLSDIKLYSNPVDIPTNIKLLDDDD